MNAETEEGVDQLPEDLAALRHTDAPARDPDYGRRVWARVSTQLGARERGQPWYAALATRLLRPAPLGVAALALTAVLAFQVGRMHGPELPELPEQVAESSSAVAPTDDRYAVGRQRVLAVSIGDHLAGTERLLMEIVNRDLDEDMDLESERQWATVLLTANRLYRYAAEQADQPRVAQVLADMEPVLLALANGGAANADDADASQELMTLRRSIEDRGLIFKARTTEVQGTEIAL